MALSVREKKAIAGVAVLGVLLAGYHYLHAPLATKRAEAAEQLQAATAELKRERAKLGQVGNLAVRKDELAQREKQIDSWVPGKNAAGMFIYHLAIAERMSGTRVKGIKMVERREITPTQQPQAAQGQQGDAGKAAQGPAPELTVVRLALTVDGPFAGQLLFNQALEEMPLFVNTDSMALKRSALNTSPALKLAQDGYFWEATQMLSVSPDLGGTYSVNVYFKQDSVGPAVQDAKFNSAAGRKDPFALDGVEQFVRTLLQAYPAQPQSTGQPGGSGAPEQLKSVPPQLG